MGIDLDILNTLSDEDVQLVINNTDLSVLLGPIKQGQKAYRKQIAILGRLEAKSTLVKKNMPGIALELFRKGDCNYRKLVAISVTNIKMVFQKLIELEDDLCMEELHNYSIEKYIELLLRFDNQSGKGLDSELLFLQLKLTGVEIEENKKKTIQQVWTYIRDRKSKFEQEKQEHEQVLLQLEHAAKEQQTSLKMEYERKLGEYIQEKNLLEKDSQGKQELIVKLLQENKEKTVEILALKKELGIKERKILQVTEEAEALQKDVEELQELLKTEREEYITKWKQELLNDEKDLLQKQEQEKKKLEELTESVKALCKEKQELEECMENHNDYVTDYLESKEKKKSSHKREVYEDRVRYENQIVAQAIGNNLLYTPLHVEQGDKAIDVKPCTSWKDYKEIVNLNLEKAGCKMEEGVLEFYSRTADNIGLIPLICGFGARKVAQALTAARYGEDATIISMPKEAITTDALEYEIEQAVTQTVIIEDLFGNGNQNVILPLLRRGTHKKLIFCLEDTGSLRDVEQYYYNYVFVIPLSKVGFQKAASFVYSKGNSFLNEKEFKEETNQVTTEQGYSFIKEMLDLSNIPYSIQLSRGLVLDCIMKEQRKEIEKAFLDWVDLEGKWILTSEQKRNVLQKMQQASFPLEKDFIRGEAY